MKATFFADTDTLYMESKSGSITESSDLDENTFLEFDAEGPVCALTIERATERTGIRTSSYEQVAA